MSSSRADPRRSSAEPNISILNPSERRRLPTATRTDSSSSTTPMTRSSDGVVPISATTVAPGEAVYLLDLGVIRIRPADRRNAARRDHARLSPRGRRLVRRPTAATMRRGTADRCWAHRTSRRWPPPYFGVIPLRPCGSDPQVIRYPDQVTEAARIFSITCPRWILTVTSMMPRSYDLLVEQPRDDPFHHLADRGPRSEER